MGRVSVSLNEFILLNSLLGLIYFKFGFGADWPWHSPFLAFACDLNFGPIGGWLSLNMNKYLPEIN